MEEIPLTVLPLIRKPWQLPTRIPRTVFLSAGTVEPQVLPVTTQPVSAAKVVPRKSTEFWTRKILLFWTRMLLFGNSASLPKVTPLPDKIPASGTMPALPERLQFCTLLLFAPSLKLKLVIQTQTPATLLL